MNNLFFSNNRKSLPFPQENRESDPPNNKVDFKKLKNNTIRSLNEVEIFLNDFNRLKNYIKLYNILK